MVKTAQKVRNEKDIGTVHDAKVGKPLPKEVTDRAQDFHDDDDEFSRMCSGKRDCISVHHNGVKKLKQMQLLLCNLKEIYVASCNKYGAEIVFFKICDLWPKFCVTVDTHSIWVCTICQNVKLMLQGPNIKDDYKLLMEKTVHNLNAKECMLQHQHHQTVFYKFQWLGFTWIDTIQTVGSQWLWNIGSKCTNNQRLHWKSCKQNLEVLGLHFPLKHQSQYVKSLKAGLKETELVVLMNSAENYSFVVKDTAQAFIGKIHKPCYRVVRQQVVKCQKMMGNIVPELYLCTPCLICWCWIMFKGPGFILEEGLT